MKKPILIILLLALSSQVYSQVTELKEVTITAVNYKYLNSVDSEDTDVSVQLLEKKAARHNLKDSDYYDDDYDTYHVTFFIPEGKILAAYDKDGTLIRTIEKFKNVKLPMKVREAIAKRYPNWRMVEDVYRVNYHKGAVKKQYKVTLKNGDETLKVKLDEKGNFQ